MAALLDLIIDEEPAERVYRPRVNPLTEYTDVEFCKRYRLPKASVLNLAHALKNRGFLGPLHGQPDQRTLSAVLVVSLYLFILICNTVVIGTINKAAHTPFWPLLYHEIIDYGY